MGRSDFLYSGFLSHLKHVPTSCQDALLRKVADFVSTDEDDILVVNGYAGTGKTTFLRNLAANTYKRMVVVAPTGVAAINAGGVTIHSFFQLPLQQELCQH